MNECEYHDCLYLDKSFDGSDNRLRRTLHHVDENHDNNDLKNLMWMHFGCHTGLHTTGKHYNRGKHCSDDHKRKISEALQGRMVGDKNPMYGRRGKNSPLYGRHHTDDRKRKISMALRGRERSEETRKKLSIAGKGRKFSKEHIARLQLSRKIGKGNYAEIKDDLMWYSGVLFDMRKVVEEFLISK